MRIRSIKKLHLNYYNIIYNNFINGFLETLIMCKNPFLCKNVKM